jgi:hypothetical protein
MIELAWNRSHKSIFSEATHPVFINFKESINESAITTHQLPKAAKEVM